MFFWKGNSCLLGAWSSWSYQNSYFQQVFLYPLKPVRFKCFCTIRVRKTPDIGVLPWEGPWCIKEDIHGQRRIYLTVSSVETGFRVQRAFAVVGSLNLPTQWMANRNVGEVTVKILALMSCANIVPFPSVDITTKFSKLLSSTTIWGKSGNCRESLS